MDRDTAEHSILQISLDPPWTLGERTVRIPFLDIRKLRLS